MAYEYLDDIRLPRDPQNVLDAATKQYVDAVTAKGAAGGDLTGTYPNPTLAVDRVKKTGDTMTGNLNFNVSGATDSPGLNFQTNALDRWRIYRGPEGAGDLYIARYDDAGNWIKTAMFIGRGNGDIFFGGSTFVENNTGNEAVLSLRGAANSVLRFQTGSSHRWTIFKNNALNDDLCINRYDDAGAYVDRPITIKRADGDIHFGRQVFIDNPGSGVGRYLYIDTTDAYAGIQLQQAGVTRWMIRKDTAENFHIARYDDTGAQIDSPFYINTTYGYITLPSTSGGIYNNSELYLRRDCAAGDGQAQISNGTTGKSAILRHDATDFWILIADTYNGSYNGMRPFKITASGVFQSPDSYNRTTTNAVNMVIGTGGDLNRSTSSYRYKHDILGLDGSSFPETVPYDRRMKPAQAARLNGSKPNYRTILDLTPVSFVADRSSDGNLRTRVGAIAEDIEEHTPWALSESKDAIEWPSVTAALLQVVKDQQATIQSLEARVTALEGAAV